MADVIPAPPDDPLPKPLDYHQDEPTPAAAIIGRVMAGIFLSWLLIIAIGFFAFFPAHPNFLHSTGAARINTVGRACQIIFFALALAAFAVTVKVWKSRPPSRWFFIGFLLGGGVMCLPEGACFSSP